MKSFVTWLVIHVVLFAAILFGGKWWMSQNPERIIVAVDSSFDMAKDWTKVKSRIDEMDNNPGPYTVFALVTDKNQVHGWQKTLDLGNAVAFGPRALDALKDEARYPLVDEATKRILITNADKPGISGWTVVRP